MNVGCWGWSYWYMKLNLQTRIGSQKKMVCFIDIVAIAAQRRAEIMQQRPRQVWFSRKSLRWQVTSGTFCLLLLLVPTVLLVNFEMPIAVLTSASRVTAYSSRDSFLVQDFHLFQWFCNGSLYGWQPRRNLYCSWQAVRKSGCRPTLTLRCERTAQLLPTSSCQA